MFLKKILPAIFIFFLPGTGNSQIVNDIPGMLLTKEIPFIGTSFYIPDSNKIVVLEKGRGRFFAVDGEVNGQPFIIANTTRDLLHPRVSTSGKLIAFYTASDEFMGDGKISVYNRDSGYVVGSYKVPGYSTLKRFRFSADSLLQYYVKFSDFNVCFTWNFRSGLINRFTFAEDSIHHGDYDISLYRRHAYLASRYADSLIMVTVNIDNTEKVWSNFYVTKSGNSTIDAQFSQGYPYLLLSDIGLNQLKVYKGLDSSFKEILSLPKLPEIIASAANEQHCYILYNDSTKQEQQTLQLLDAVEDKTVAVPISYLNSKKYIFNIYPEKDLLTASHVVNGTMATYSLSKGTLLWNFTAPVEKNIVHAMQHDSIDSKLFKVLIKQGSADVDKWYFNQAANHFYLFKGQTRLVTVDADAKCALKWESFYTGNNIVTESRLLPGYRYILYTEKRWKENPTAFSKGLDGKMEANKDINKKDQLYPYGFRIYDRQSGKDIFILNSVDDANVRIINDSLICFVDKRDKGDADSILIYNLNTGISFKIKPAGFFAVDYIPLFYNNQLYFFISTLEDELILVNSRGRQIFKYGFKEVSDIINKVKLVDNSSFFYLEAGGTKTGPRVYRIYGDSVSQVKNLPAGIEILATKASERYCYMMYKKLVERKSGNMIFYCLAELLSGSDRIIDSVMSDEDNSYANYALYPEQNYYLENNNNNIIVFRDLITGNEIKDFGRDEATIVSLAYSPDGRYLAAANPEGKVKLWDLGTGRETKTLDVAREGYITKLAFSGDGRWLAASSGDIWETATGKNIVSVTDGSIWSVKSIDFSLDGSRIISGGACIISWDASDGSKMYFQQEPGSSNMDTSGTCWNPNGCVDPKFPFMVHSTAFHPNSRDFVTGNVSGLIQKWNTENRVLAAHQFLSEIPGQANTVYDIKYTRDGKFIITLQEKMLYRLDGNTLKVTDSLLLPDGETILGIDMGYDSLYFGCISKRRNNRIIQIRNINDLSVKKEFVTEGASFNTITFSPNKKQVATASENGFCTIWDLQTGNAVMHLNTIGDYGNIMVTPDNYYMASKSALDGVSFSKDDNFYSFDQFDLYLNRPDIVLSRLGYASPELINFYRAAYLKRLKKATGSTADTVIKAYVPELILTNKKDISLVNTRDISSLQFSITDSAEKKGRLSISINGNLVKEHYFNEERNINFVYSDSIQLSQGLNNVEAVYADHNMIESRKEKIIVNYSPARPAIPRFWFIGIGVSNYKIPAMNLKYPAKDVRDLSIAFKKKYPGIIIDTLLDARATKENILALREKLMKTNIDDKVIISFNGHGLLSDSLDWYFATYDIDIKKPEKAGLPYEMMENLLHGIPARQKLLLVDACHSGEIDKEKDISFANAETPMENNVTATPRGTIVIGKSKAGLQTSFEMMQELFTNLNNGNGTTVLSAAGGREYALESDQWKNGVFTYCVLKALKDPATDVNKDKKISVKELKKVVFETVKNLTGGRQKPTSRVEVWDDWNIW